MIVYTESDIDHSAIYLPAMEKDGCSFNSQIGLILHVFDNSDREPISDHGKSRRP